MRGYLPRNNRRVRRSSSDPNYYTRAGAVMVLKPDGSSEVIPAYSPSQHQQIVRIRASVSEGTRQRLFLRDGGRCRYCNAPLSQFDFEVDHVVPVAMGGSNRISNLVCACSSCNQRKGARVWTPRPLRRVSGC